MKSIENKILKVLKINKIISTHGPITLSFQTIENNNKFKFRICVVLSK